MKKNIDELKKILNEIKEGHKNHYQEDYPFPAKDKSNDVSVNLSIFIDQSEKLINGDLNLGLCKDLIDIDDVDNLAGIFCTDIRQFITKNYKKIKFKTNLNLIGQSVIREHALFNIARARILNNSYKEIDLGENDEMYNLFSIPFLLRLSIENKVKKIIGFESYDIKIKNRENKIITIENQKNMPVNLVLKELHGLDCIDLPCDFSDLINIYGWACNFCHTAEKESIWMISLATSKISPLFDYELNTSKKKAIYEILGIDISSKNHKHKTDDENPGQIICNEELIKEIYLYESVVCFLKIGLTIKMVEEKLNSSKNPKLKNYKFKLNVSEMEDFSGFFVKKKYRHI